MHPRVESRIVLDKSREISDELLLMKAEDQSSRLTLGGNLLHEVGLRLHVERAIVSDHAVCEVRYRLASPSNITLA